ncbi:hypothetical protein EVAR_101982_1 [Eumeta japonica]|uniref:Uncharacterized protein n=1 Tax=Eumeta variegata TaxID=151549 RepID=A0A4C1TST3_EUMVA|nr:hypothetical protein EVAR_101982_1 [Eumeta japonica]
MPRPHRRFSELNASAGNPRKLICFITYHAMYRYHTGAQHGELSAAARSRHEQKEFKGADVRLTVTAVAPPRAPRRA